MSTYTSGSYGECNGGVTKIETESKKQRMPIGKNALPVSILTPTAKQSSLPVAMLGYVSWWREIKVLEYNDYNWCASWSFL